MGFFFKVILKVKPEWPSLCQNRLPQTQPGVGQTLLSGIPELIRDFCRRGQQRRMVAPCR